MERVDALSARRRVIAAPQTTASRATIRNPAAVDIGRGRPQRVNPKILRALGEQGITHGGLNFIRRLAKA